MKPIIRILSLAVAVLLLSAVLPTAASAVSFENEVKTYSDSILMVNIDTGMEVFSKDPDSQRYPAGLTKVMTYIIAAEYFDDFSTRIPIKQSIVDDMIAEGMSCSGLDWHIGENMTVTDILYALMVPVGHDAAMVLADYIGDGDISVFVDMMNAKAKQLGCNDTHFMNPTGVHHRDHYSTARDLYRMTMYAIGLPMFSKICGTATHYMEGDDYPLVTTNYMIDVARGGDYFYTYATGLKNSTTDEAGRCLIATARLDEDGYSYICICLHAPYNYERDIYEQYCMIEAANLFRWAFLNLTYVTPVTKDTPICEQKIDHAWDTDSILLVPESDLNIVLPDTYSEADVTIVPDSTDPVSAPINKGDFVTTATVYYKGQSFMSINLLAQESVSVSPMLYVTDAVRSVLTSPWFLLAVALIVVLFVVYVTISSSYAKKKRGGRSRTRSKNRSDRTSRPGRG